MDPLFIPIAIGAVLVALFVALVIARRRLGAADPRSASALKARLSRTRAALSDSLGGLFSGDAFSDDGWESLEDALITADVGPITAAEIVARVRGRRPTSGAEARDALVGELIASLSGADRSLRIEGSPAVIVVVGVNGTGKTTSIAKIAASLVDGGRSVVLGAADTFRAAADAQLREWGGRVGVPVVSGAEGADPASVAHDAFMTARADSIDVVIVDTAGRLHSKSNLMDELGKIVRVLDREASGISEVLLVLDGTTGQNGITQARSFTEAVGVTGVVLTKLDGTSRGGVAVAVEQELGIPVKFIGVGEGMYDLIPFVPKDFVEALLES
ncbi:MAG: signal recognition particle-docking protein FtsY [Acidimicrobiia bacterium]